MTITARITPRRIQAPERPAFFKPESAQALKELGSLLLGLVKLSLWLVALAANVLFLGLLWWWIVPVLWIVTAILKIEDPEKVLELQRIAALPPRAREAAEQLAVLKEIRAHQWF